MTLEQARATYDMAFNSNPGSAWHDRALRDLVSAERAAETPDQTARRLFSEADVAWDKAAKLREEQSLLRDRIAKCLAKGNEARAAELEAEHDRLQIRIAELEATFSRLSYDAIFIDMKSGHPTPFRGVVL